MDTEIMVKVLAAQSCPTFCDPVECSPRGSSLHGILQARIVDWVAIFFSRDLPQYMVHIYNGILLSYKKNTFESAVIRWMT